MNEYQKRQTHQIIESIKSYKVGQLTLNKLILKLEALVAFNEMSVTGQTRPSVFSYPDLIAWGKLRISLSIREV